MIPQSLSRTCLGSISKRLHSSLQEVRNGRTDATNHAPRVGFADLRLLHVREAAQSSSSCCDGRTVLASEPADGDAWKTRRSGVSLPAQDAPPGAWRRHTMGESWGPSARQWDLHAVGAPQRILR